MSRPGLLGVDGGGTSTTAWLADARGPGPGPGRAGPSNIKAVGAEAARDGPRPARSGRRSPTPGSRSGPVEVSCLGLAGFDRPDDQRWLEAWAERLALGRSPGPGQRRRPRRRGRDARGLGRRGDRRDRLDRRGPGPATAGRPGPGGWGHLFGDEGSGYAVALAGPPAGRPPGRRPDPRAGRPATRSRPGSARPWGSAGRPELVSAVYREGFDRARLAALAPAVVAASRRTTLDLRRDPRAGRRRAGRGWSAAVARSARARAGAAPAGDGRQLPAEQPARLAGPDPLADRAGVSRSGPRPSPSRSRGPWSWPGGTSMNS